MQWILSYTSHFQIKIQLISEVCSFWLAQLTDNLYFLNLNSTTRGYTNTELNLGVSRMVSVIDILFHVHLITHFCIGTHFTCNHLPVICLVDSKANTKFLEKAHYCIGLVKKRRHVLNQWFSRVITLETAWPLELGVFFNSLSALPSRLLMKTVNISLFCQVPLSQFSDCTSLSHIEFQTLIWHWLY